MSGSGDTERASGGGRATHAGINFQDRVAAWVATRILFDTAGSPIFGLRAIPDFLRCETEQPVDDLLVGSRIDSFAFVQIKHSLDLSDAASSPLASVVDQFARQMLAYNGGKRKRRPWERKPDPENDALVLVTGPRSSGVIREDLRSVLTNVRQLLGSQSISDASGNAAEARALQAVVEHFARSYRSETGSAPPESEIRVALRLMRVEVLDVDANGQAEREAKDVLRTVILKDPAQADAAWATLIQGCGHLAETHSGADRSALQQILLANRFELNTPRSYQRDVQQLQRVTEKTEEVLSDLARIRVGETFVRIDRAVTQEILRLGEIGPTLVVGEPGAGKSGALSHYVEQLRARGTDCVVLAVDRLAAATASQLQSELGLEHELDEVLENWPGREPAFLVIDALDAARGGPGAQTIRELIARVSNRNKRWRIIASIRKFDLRYSEELRDLFAGKENGRAQPEFRDDEFLAVSHVNVRRLSESELNEVRAQSAALGALIGRAGVKLRELLRIPFNLRLLAVLLGAGTALDQLTPIRTQLDLLDKYWRRRVIGEDGNGHAREDILRRACEGMTAARVLRVDQALVADTAGSQSLDSLLSAQVLVEWQPFADQAPNRYVLAFSHHVLFDYSAARLLLRGNRNALVQRIEEEPEISLILRPSFLLHYQHLWNHESLPSFWDFVFQIARSSRVPEIGKLIGPSAAADLVDSVADFEPLLTKLSGPDDVARLLAEQVFQHVVGAVLVAPRSTHPLLGLSAGPWAELAERVSRNLQAPTAYSLRPLLSDATEARGGWTLEQLRAWGFASRRLLEFAWGMGRRDEWLVAHALQCVCRTFESDPAGSAALIRRALAREHLQEYGFKEMPWLAREVRTLMTLDRVLVEDIYTAIFTFQEDSEAPTEMSPSRILRLSGNRKQDYGMARYELATVFPAFLSLAPENATRVCIVAVEAYVRDERSAPRDATPESFQFRGRPARILTDYSSIWDARLSTQNDDPVRLLDVLTQHCDRLGEDGPIEEFRKLLELIIQHNYLAVFWRRLLALGAKHPATIGLELAPVVSSIPVLTAMDTSQPCGEYLAACFATLPVADRELIERAIVAIPEKTDQEGRSHAEHTRNRLLGCIPPESLATEDAKAILTELMNQKSVPSNEPPMRFGGAYSGPYGEVDYLRGQGVPVESAANVKIQQLEQPAVTFATKHQNSTPTSAEMESVMPALRALFEALGSAEEDGVDPKQSDYAWGVLAEACERIAKSGELSCQSVPGQFVKEVLLLACNHSNPEPSPKYDAQFDKSPSWGGPSARISAAQGLAGLVQDASCATSDVLDAVERLCEDPVPAVRFQIAVRLVGMYRTDRDRMWRLIGRFGEQESSRGVLSGLLSHMVGRIAGAHPQEVAEFIRRLLSRDLLRDLEGTGNEDVIAGALGILTGLYVWQDHALSREVLDTFVSKPSVYGGVLSQIQFNLRDLLTYSSADPAKTAATDIRRRAFEVFGEIIDSAKSELDDLEREHPGTAFDSWPEIDRERTKKLVRVLDHAAKELYFASGAFDNKRQNRRPGQQDLTTEERKRFFEESRRIVDVLADLGFPSIAHNLVQTLESFVLFNPRHVFLTVGRVVRAGVNGGYQFEQMAADVVVRLVERYLAEHRDLLQDDAECREVLVELLDTFIRAGWSNARQLTYRLEDIFR